MSADHVQQQILDWLIASIKAADTDAGQEVGDEDRLRGWQQGALPAVVVEGPGGGELAGDLGEDLDRAFDVSVRCLVSGSAGVARAARRLAAQVERAIGSSLALDDTPFIDADLVSEPSYQSSDEGEQLFGAVTQLWKFTYRTNRADATVSVH